MKRPLLATLIGAAVFCGLAVPAHADLFSGTLGGIGVLTPVSPGVFLQNFTGAGDDALLGHFTAVSQSTINFTNPLAITITNGTFTETFPGGTLMGTSSGDGTLSGAGSGTVEIDISFTGGTGQFAGLTAQATFTGNLVKTSPTTVMATGTYTGTIAAVPEPGPLAMVAFVAAVLLRKSRQRRAHPAGLGAA